MADPTPNILLVDDNAAHRKLIKRAMVKDGLPVRVLEAASLSEARSALFCDADHDREILAAAIIDLNLGDGRGTALLEEIRRSPAHAEMPILILSTSNLEADILECYALGANRYLVKSDDLGRLSKDIGRELAALLGLSDV